MTGPVGILVLPMLLKIAPAIPENAPKMPAKIAMISSLFVHCLAATAGATSNALIKTTPTVSKPATITITNNKESKTSIKKTGKPRLWAKDRSKQTSWKCFQKMKTVIRHGIAIAARSQTSRSKSVAAWPNKKRASPAWAASGRRWTQVRSIRPKPKNTERVIANALSSLTLLNLLIPRMTMAAMVPEIAAPSIRAQDSLLLKRRNARMSPGKQACEIASPIRLCFLKTAKVPRVPHKKPNSAVPATTLPKPGTESDSNNRYSPKETLEPNASFKFVSVKTSETGPAAIFRTFNKTTQSK